MGNPKRFLLQSFKLKITCLGQAEKLFLKLLLIVPMALGVALTACDDVQKRSYTVGVVNILPNLEITMESFKAGMAELGYIEGKNIRYIYNGPTTDTSKLFGEVQNLLALKVDLILSITTPATLAAKKAAAGGKLPIVFAVVADPLGAGIVESIQQPGKYITGIAFGIQEERRLEWFKRIAPGIKRVYVPYFSKDNGSVLYLESVHTAAGKLGLELILHGFHSPEKLNGAVLNIPEDIDAVFFLPDSYMTTRLTDMARIATKRNLPTSVPDISAVKTFDVLTSFGFDQHQYGRQAARLVDQIFKGARPSDLPVETAELFLAVNLKTSKTIGLDISDEILRHTDVIVH